jgi:hypothetical protein
VLPAVVVRVVEGGVERARVEVDHVRGLVVGALVGRRGHGLLVGQGVGGGLAAGPVVSVLADAADEFIGRDLLERGVERVGEPVGRGERARAAVAPVLVVAHEDHEVAPARDGGRVQVLGGGGLQVERQREVVRRQRVVQAL